MQRKQRVALSHDLSGETLDVLVKLGLELRPDVAARLVDVWNADEAGRSPSAFTGPVLIVRGASDSFVTEEIAAAISDRFKHGVLETVTEAGHWANLRLPGR